MSDRDDGPAYRTRHRATGDDMAVREPEPVDGDGDVFTVRLPVASLGDVRNEGDDPLTRDELDGMARQIRDRQIGVFPSHGDDGIVASGRYSQFEKLGVWTDATVDEREAGADVLLATARMPDPEELPESTGEFRQALAILKEQAKRGIPMDASIGWRDDGDFPGGVDLMEVSIVGIGADPRTTTNDDAAEVVARAAVDAGADPDTLVDAVRDAVTDARPLGPPEDPDRFETFDECVDALSDDPDTSREDAEAICGSWEQAKEDQAARVDDGRAEYEVGDETVDITPLDKMQTAADLALEKAQAGLGDDCGTGVGTDRANQIVTDQVGPEVVVEIAAYLTSHEEDVTADGSPSEWTDDEWDDCGNIQYAKWGGDGSGDALDWAQRHANAVAEARDEEVPYPNRSMRNIDDPEFAEGDAVMWSSQDTPVHGRVAGIHEEFTPPALDDPITGDDGEAVYSIHEYDETVEAFRRQNVAKPQSSLSESQKDLPPATDENFESMSDEPPGDDAGTDDAQDAPDDGDETTRAPADIGADDMAEFMAEAFTGVNSGDILDLMADAGAEYSGLEVSTLSWFLGDVLDMPASEVDEMLDAAAGDGDGDDDGGEAEMGDDEDDEDDGDMDGEQAADAADLKARLDALEDTLERVKNGDVPVGDDTEGTDADADADAERDADAADDADSTETRNDEGDADPAPIRVSDL
jgi:hypothetical protein